MSVSAIVQELQARRAGSGWLARCPCHDDKTPSLSIREGDEGQPWLTCHAGCDRETIKAEMKRRGVWPVSNGNGTAHRNGATRTKPETKPPVLFATADAAIEAYRYGTPDRSWTYTDGDSNPVGVVARWNKPDKKIIRPVARVGDGWAMRGMQAPRPLFRLPAIVGTDRLFLVEGEGCVDAALSVGLPATTSAGGSNAPHETDWTPVAGHDLFILVDNDGPGRKYGQAIANIATTLSPPATVRVVELPGLPEGGDIVDWIQQREGADPGDLRAEIEVIAAATPVFIPPDAEDLSNFDPGMDELPDELREVQAEMMSGDDGGANSKNKKTKTVTPMGHARKLLDDHFTHTDGNLSLRWWNGVFYEWNGRHYLPIATGDVRARIIRWLDRSKIVPSRNLAAEIIAALESLTLVPADTDIPAYWDGSRWTRRNLLPVDNGLLDVDRLLDGDDTLTPHTPQWFSTFALPYAYDPKASCPEWFKTLDANFNGDAECVRALAEIFGNCLTSETKWHVIAMLEGPPRSGKSLMLKILQAAIGEANCVSPRLSMLAEQFGLWGLVGKRVALCPDAHLGRGDKAMAVMETLKSVSGEDALEVHRKHLPSVTMRLRTRFILAVNELPKFGDSAGALASRLLILPCPNSYRGREDRDLESKLLPELPGVLNWMIDGLRRLHRQGGFTRPEASRAIERDFERLSSPTKAFLDDCCIIHPTREVGRLALFGAWKAWCESTGHHPGSIQRFGATLRLFIPRLDGNRTMKDDGTRERTYIGVGLRTGVEVQS